MSSERKEEVQGQIWYFWMGGQDGRQNREERRKEWNSIDRVGLEKAEDNDKRLQF